MVGLLLIAALLAQPSPPEVKDVLVIVNEQNPVRSLSREEVARIFTKRTVRWEDWDGMPRVEPVDQQYSSAVREVFTREVHGKPLSSIRTYWHRLIFSGRGAPPLQKNTDEEVMAYVRENPGAIGYVVGGSDLVPGVRSIELTDGD